MAQTLAFPRRLLPRPTNRRRKGLGHARLTRFKIRHKREHTAWHAGRHVQPSCSQLRHWHSHTLTPFILAPPVVDVLQCSLLRKCALIRTCIAANACASDHSLLRKSFPLSLSTRGGTETRQSTRDLRSSAVHATRSLSSERRQRANTVICCGEIGACAHVQRNTSCPK